MDEQSPYINMENKITSSQKKKLNQYQKRELEFQQVYLEKLKELRIKSSPLNKIKEDQQSQENLIEKNKIDIALYKERNEQYKILSNNIMARAFMDERKYVHKSIKILEKFLDPIRIRLRIMPLSRAPLAQGKNSDFYFVEAAKISLKGNLPLAIQMLKKGLDLKPTHFLCRFNHGVVQFKLGLINNALEDFEMLVSLYPKEPQVNYNLAICYTQTGRYQEGIQQCNKTIEICN